MSPNGSTQVNDYQPNVYSPQNDLPKQQVTKRLKTTLHTATSSPVTRPCYNLLYRLSTSTYSHQNGLPKETTLNNQCSPSTHAVSSRQHWTVANSPSLSRTTNAV